MSAVEVDSVITCPQCGFAKRETMPTDACQFYYECEGCKALLRPKPGDCCVFCSFGSVRCPPMQTQGSDQGQPRVNRGELHTNVVRRMIPCRGNAGPPGSIPSKTVPRPISANVTRRARAPMKLLSAASLSRLQHRGGAYTPIILVLEN